MSSHGDSQKQVSHSYFILLYLPSLLHLSTSFFIIKLVETCHDWFTYSKQSPEEDPKRRLPDTWISCCFFARVCLHTSYGWSCWRSSVLVCHADATRVNVLGHDPDSRHMKPQSAEKPRISNDKHRQKLGDRRGRDRDILYGMSDICGLGYMWNLFSKCNKKSLLAVPSGKRSESHDSISTTFLSSDSFCIYFVVGKLSYMTLK